jgi:hypothetical protein
LRPDRLRWLLLAALAVATGYALTAGAPAVTVAGAYLCPMHPQVRAAAPGQCPVCAMDLVREAPARPSREVLVLGAREVELGAIRLVAAAPGPERSVRVPWHALLVRPEGTTVFVAGPDRRSFSARVVRAERIEGSDAIVAAGLRPGEWVVEQGASLLEAERRRRAEAPR